MIITVFVRLPRDKNRSRRRVTFVRPDGITDDEILELGGAIDGNQAVFEVSLKRELRDLEIALYDLMKKHNYTVDLR